MTIVRGYVPQPRRRKPLSAAKLQAKKEKKILRKLTKEQAELSPTMGDAADDQAADQQTPVINAVPTRKRKDSREPQTKLYRPKEDLVKQARQIARQGAKDRKSTSIPQTAPWLLFVNETSDTIDFPGLELVGTVAGENTPVKLRQDDCINAPEGSRLLTLTQRAPVGYEPNDREVQVLSEDPLIDKADMPKRSRTWTPEAVAMALPSPYLATHYSSFNSLSGGQILPHLFYTPVGWWKKTSQFLVPAFRIDDDPRNDLQHFDDDTIQAKMQEKLEKFPENRLVRHLSQCVDNYSCLCAINFFMERWEMPVPTSPSGNTMCLGCESLSDHRKNLNALYKRIPFVPTAEEIVEAAVDHLSIAPRAIISFGQSCEGEPLMQSELLCNVISSIRKRTKRGTIHVNTNGTMPEVVAKLRESGLDSLRVEVNSVRPSYFNRYVRYNYAPIVERINKAQEERMNRMKLGQTVDEQESQISEEEIEPEDAFYKAKETLKIMKEMGGFTSIKYMILPGLNDERQEVKELGKFIEETRIDMVQWRNIAIDPEYYLTTIKYEPPASTVLAEKLGVKELISSIRKQFPHLRHGYFNPCLDEKAVGYNLVE